MGAFKFEQILVYCWLLREHISLFVEERGGFKSLECSGLVWEEAHACILPEKKLGGEPIALIDVDRT